MSTKFQICMGLLVLFASLRFRLMDRAGFLIEGSYFQHAELLLNAFTGICWTSANLTGLAIHLSILMMFVQVTSIFLSVFSMNALVYYGTFRVKYFLEDHEKWSFERLVQAEAYLDIMIGMMAIKALEEIERDYMEAKAELAGQKHNEKKINGEEDEKVTEESSE
ncbi:Protein CBG26489 [Caenorhabditis briggsae]|uniref:Protein CBG26489 n=2 Tax=Caenorhabditis briggsae TaxID=6238 RepID=B6IH40_CAEBR|nr:Protein CBG26489 [Caenorhabditis briggsae]CAR99220.1 Protein CBG26489 [Caenorhabditis briggsae]